MKNFTIDAIAKTKIVQNVRNTGRRYLRLCRKYLKTSGYTVNGLRENVNLCSTTAGPRGGEEEEGHRVL